MKKLTLTALTVFSAVTVHAVYADSAEMLNPDNGHTYKRFDKVKTWTQAKAACESAGAHLATITSKVENDWINSKFHIDKDFMFWLGATDVKKEGTWLWVTDEKWQYTNWESRQPDNNGSNEHYLQMSGGVRELGKWNDLDNTFLSYLCEWELPYNQYFRVISLSDINANGSADFAFIGGFANNHLLFVYDGDTNAVINKSTITPRTDKHIGSVKIASDSNHNGAPELALVIVDDAHKTSALQLQDTLTGEILKTTNLPKWHTPILTLPDLNANAIPDFALIANVDNNYTLFVYDGGTHAIITQAIVKERTSHRINSTTLTEDSNHNGAPEIAVLISKISDQNTSLQLHDTLTGDLLKTINLLSQ